MTATVAPEQATCAETLVTSGRVREIVAAFLGFLETGEVPPGLLADDVFGDISLPTWRLQAVNAVELLQIRRAGHPMQGRVPRYRVDPTSTGFVLEWEETWVENGRPWYCREMCRADVSEAGITSLSVYCTGDWDEARMAEHRAAVELGVP